MKLIIDISEENYKNIKEQVDKRDYPDMQTGRAIVNGTPLDKVKAEIEQIRLNRARFRTSDGTVVYVDSQNILEVLNNILDNIGKESEKSK